MTWEELAYFINHAMSEQERKKDAIVWDSSVGSASGGAFMLVEDIQEFDADNDPGTDYSMNINTDNCWF